jgi:hypothetical protein
MFGLDAKAYVLADVVNGLSPVWKFKHPITGLYYALKISSIGNTENPGYTVTYHDNNSFIGNLLEKLDELHAKILEILKALADKLGDIACSTLNTPGGAAAATAAAGPYGAAGAMAAAALCKPGALPPPPPPSGGGYLLPLAIGGGLLLIVAAVARRR